MAWLNRRLWDWITPAIGALGLIGPGSAVARAQAPVIIPGLPGTGLQIGERPETNRWPYTDLVVGASPRTISDAPAPPTYGVTGDWRGLRDALFDEGIDVRAAATQFEQGAAGGLRQGPRYGLKLDYFATIEADKLFGWDGLFVNLHGESRFGQSVNRDLGSLIPANFALEFPRPTGTASALTNVQVEQFIGPNLVATFGKLNAADGVNLHPFLGGNGVDRFLNEAFVLSPVYGRTIPYSTPGAGFSRLRGSEPVFTFLVLDSSGVPYTSGLSRMFRNGATLFTQFRIPVKPFGRPGHQSIEAAYASGKFSPLTEDDYVLLPTAPGRERSGTWVVTYGFDQFLRVDPESPNRGWGVFGNVSLADPNTNPIHWFLNLGAGGVSPLPGRSADTFGAGYYYLGASEALREALQSLAPIRNEQGFEFFYNAAITPWFVLTADLQAIDPAQLDARSSLVLALRAKLSF